MNRIDQKFRENKKLLSIYFSAGFPNLEDTVPILKKLQTAGVDMVPKVFANKMIEQFAPKTFQADVH